MAQPPSGAPGRAELAPVLASPAGDGGPGRRRLPVRHSCSGGSGTSRASRPTRVAVKSVAGQGIETVYIPAPRGEIFDRNGVLLAGNKIEQVVTVAPGAEARPPRDRGRALGAARRTASRR